MWSLLSRPTFQRCVLTPSRRVTCETSVRFKETTQRNIPEGYNLHIRRRENLKPHVYIPHISLGYTDMQGN
jgi:hypothetical protein